MTRVLLFLNLLIVNIVNPPVTKTAADIKISL